MSSTATAKKPTAPCAACNKEGAVFRCAPCRDAGVDVFFCNRECQVKLWKMHKSVCKKTSTVDLKKEQSSANKEAKQETKKGSQLRIYTQCCAKCLKTDNDIGSKVSMCSKCKKVFYCSRECQVEDWSRHKSLCKFHCETLKHLETSFDSREMNIYNLFQNWVTKSRTKSCCSGAVYLALKKNGIEQQPLVKAVLIEVQFNYNAQTFIVAEEPKAVAIADLSQQHKKEIRKILKEPTLESDQGYNHFVIISTKELGERCETTIALGITKSVLENMNAANIDMFKLRNKCAGVSLKSDLFRGWKSIRRNNLQKQMEQMKLGQSYTEFIQSALQLFCKKTLRNTHRIIVNMNMGKEIGQISQFLDYKLVSIAEFKQIKEELEKYIIHVEDIASQPPSCTEMAIETLFIDFETCVDFEYIVFCEVDGMRNKTAKQCKKAADKQFRKLQKSVKEMPVDLLEKVSL
ncbi:hypothetical protein CTEN210_04504 [Chaetoceros tenuissimus]|uniref:MYND-type domain-containing protein n=1 Tax=Chaetoceros tenuissimus TaxID=426638 RepID=A0AAD3CLZ7_9STRA|nr:hypothetical protein CTEN210_04504 [Chaetoceros tenuissimus]